MIRGLRCKDTQALFEGRHPRRFRAIETVATRKLAMLDAAKTLHFMRSPPGYRLESLRGDRAGQLRVRPSGSSRAPRIDDRVERVAG